MGVTPADAIRALRRQLTVAGALGRTLGQDADVDLVKVRHERDDDAGLDEEIEPAPRRAALDLTREDDGRTR